MNNFIFGDATRQYYETICGGAGAGPGFDGTSAVHTHMTNTRMTDPEVLELRYPVRLEAFAIRRGSGGAGGWRGGDGAVRRIRFLEPMTAVIVSSRRNIAPFGLAGGLDGALGRQWVERSDGRRRCDDWHRPHRTCARRHLRHRDPRWRRLRSASAVTPRSRRAVREGKSRGPG
jgi:5-oxoprolinase (ATP-hydrolysing)